MWKFTLALLCVLNVILAVLGDGKYMVIGPGTIHSDRKYNVAVGVYLTDEPCQLKIGITGPAYNETKIVNLHGNEIKNIEFKVPKLDYGIYNLMAEGVTGIAFKNSTDLLYHEVPLYTAIQTDKGAYRAGDVINFRVLFLDENLKPAQPPADTIIWIEDGKSNRIKEIKDIEVIKGVFTGNCKLSEYPILGRWTIYVRGDAIESSTVYFDVSKYDLPKYNVQVDANKIVSLKDGDIQVVVRSNYTYGAPVNGKVTLEFALVAYIDITEPDIDAPIIVKTTNMINGKAKFDLNLKEYWSHIANKPYRYIVTTTATVEENFTGLQLSGSTETRLLLHRYSMMCASRELCFTYQPDKESNVSIRISLVDGTNVKDTKGIVKLKYTEELVNIWDHDEDTEDKNEHKEFVFESHINEMGLADFKIKLPELVEYQNYSHFYQMRVEYDNEIMELNSAYPYSEMKHLYIEKEENFTAIAEHSYDLGSEATITLKSSSPMQYFVYVLTGRGNILRTERIDLPDQPNVYNLTFTTTFEMASTSKVYFYYIDLNGELHFTEVQFLVETKLQNQIEITSVDKVKPDEEVVLHIKTAPNSFVGLLAVDQRALRLDYNNDLKEHEAIEWMGSYDTYNTRTPPQDGYSPYPGEKSGVVTLTNANYLYNRTEPESGPHRPSHGLSPSSLRKLSGVRSKGVVVRKDYPVTWIFDNINNTETEEFTWRKKIPDTMNSWILTGFSVNDDKGLGITKEATNLTTFLPFYISIRLPATVKRGEVINVPALVFNYLEKDLDVDVALDNTDNEYEFIDVTDDIINETKRTKTIHVTSNSATGVSFMIRPKVIGNIMLKFTAISPVAGDAIHKTLKVVAEGVTEYANRAYLINLNDLIEFKESFELEFPNQIVPESQRVEFAVVGDLLGPILLHINNLIRMPTTGGEQTTSQLVINYLLLDYLKNINNSKVPIEMQLIHNLESGYQNILNYRHDDGSFSSFGPSTIEDKHVNGSTWLTAYILRNLHSFKKYVHISETVLEEGLSYLANSQADNGAFIEMGDYFYSSQKDHILLTANVLLAFLENKALATSYQKNIDNALKYILENIEKTENLYVQVLAAYTLYIAEHPLSKDIVSRLKSLAKTEDDRMWWSITDIKPRQWWRSTYNNDVEITSYILLILLDNPSESTDDIMSIIKWLVAQRNSFGGFYSTQDTVVGLQALLKFVQKTGYKAADMEVNVISKTGDLNHQNTITTNADNALLLQSIELPAETTAVDFHAKGNGAALVQISYQYNVIQNEEKPTFIIKSTVNKNVPPFKLDLIVCVDYAGANEASNMAVLEISLPSGYIMDSDNFENILKVKRVRHVETKDSSTVLVIYFENLHKNDEQCLPVEAHKSFPVAKQKPASVVVYDYYDPAKKTIDYYEVESKLCDLCKGDDEDDDCKKNCELL